MRKSLKCSRKKIAEDPHNFSVRKEIDQMLEKMLEDMIEKEVEDHNSSRAVRSKIMRP